MKRTRWLLALVVVLLAAPGAHAQVFVPVPAGGFEFGFTRFKRKGAFSFSVSRGYRAYYRNPYLAPLGGPVYAEVRVYAPPPPQTVIVQAPPVIQVLQAPVPADVLNPPPLTPPPIDEVVKPQPPDRPLPGREAGRFRPLEPDNRERARQPFRPEQQPDRPPRERPEQPPPRPRLPRPLLPEADPRAESNRQLALGREAFALAEYGRAAERFRLARDAAPGELLPHFLLAQAHLALGNYRRAFNAIQVGLNLNPDWPAAPFRPLDLYADNGADYAGHLATLEDVRAANPNDAVLLFLSGYALWFDGRRDEARELFEGAAPALPNPGVVERFLQALPIGPVL